MDILDRGEQVPFCNPELLGDKSRFNNPEVQASITERKLGMPLAFKGNAAKWISFCKAADLVYRKG